MKIICSICGSENVEIRTWIKCNSAESTTTQIVDATFNSIEDVYPEDCWCNECQEHTVLNVEREKNDN